jgi:hypothetical protein
MSTQPNARASDPDLDVKDSDLLEHVEHKKPRRRTPEEKQAALTAALAVDPGVDRWSRRAFQVCTL